MVLKGLSLYVIRMYFYIGDDIVYVASIFL